MPNGTSPARLSTAAAPPEPPASPAAVAVAAPVLEVAAGHPSAEELAAVLAALSIRVTSRPGGGGERPRRSAWAQRSALLRLPPAPGPDAWRRSARPR